MKFITAIASGVLIAVLTGCGGGGGNPGSTSTTASTSSSTTATSTTGNTVTSATSSMSIDVLSGAGVASTSISTVEIAQAKITLKDASGAPVQGVVVTFTESGGTLLTIAPASKTALTDANGQAGVELRAASTSGVGATTIAATTNVSGQAVSVQKAIAITSAPSGGPVVLPQDLANAINFLDVNPADKSIVLAGSGGNGRSESATLRFRVVDKNNTPVKGVAVSFVVVPSTDVTLNIAAAVSDADGVVVTTVSSKNVATAVVIKASVEGKVISSQSDQLLVTTGIATQAGFDLSATKYNLNYGITGDSSDITVRIVDSNGNPVSDGVPVVFTTNFGAVGSSSRGGCSTLNGGCKVTYSVQEPRPTDGTYARVIASTQIGNGTTVSGFLDLIISNPGLLDIYSLSSAGVLVNNFNLVGVCKATVFAYAGTPAGFPAPAGTTVEVKAISTDFAATLKTDSPILDLARSRTLIGIEFDATAAALAPACVAGGPNTASGIVQVKFTAGTRVRTIFLNVNYPVN
jgi:Bacterial Ig-like domain (group 1)